MEELVNVLQGEAASLNDECGTAGLAIDSSVPRARPDISDPEDSGRVGV